ncbi:hypothetical protein BN1051_01365 [Arthrobacter saudimassiliensis]|uniref:Uncharacterized protein n=1 Tax=Arthrobacter saudimassiliensis TaxID=1461584 RepID=A0A078MP42_9MICC|nr:hypothetical protein BN1051_01365 [Arthrobacter saudimassiliensis]
MGEPQYPTGPAQQPSAERNGLVGDPASRPSPSMSFHPVPPPHGPAAYPGLPFPPYPVPPAGPGAWTAHPAGRPQPRGRARRLRGALLWNLVAAHLVWFAVLALNWGCAAFLGFSALLSNPNEDYSAVMDYVRLSFWGPLAAVAAGWAVAGPALALRRSRLAVWALCICVYGWTLLWLGVTVRALMLL